ncbi:MAG: hypothetical protein J6S51_04555 [Kiritimatiellae bacterium]|nr:hypothetical protein [Kiritimatiellia bacterium]
MLKKLFSASVLLAFAGCFTLTETQYPETQLTRSDDFKTITIKGFEASLTEYVTMYGIETVYVPGYYGRRYWYPGRLHNVQTATSIQQDRSTDRFLVQAKDRLEEAGFNIKANPANYVVEVRFTGPFWGSEGKRALWYFLTALTCDKAEQSWHAKLKVYDNNTGKLLFVRDYQQEYSATGFSPLPLLGMACYERTEPNYMQCWALHALTDRATADASAFLGSLKK